VCGGISCPLSCLRKLDKTRHELNPKTWTVSVNRLFDTQSGILPG
ncbi:hypothetical protein XM84_004627, partial [Salmonella enterica subsp. enterica]|nr:hypothetical protein [Salmonella enterica subsp. enterica]